MPYSFFQLRLLLSACYPLATILLPSSYLLPTIFLLSCYLLPSGFLEHTLNVASSYLGCTLDVPCHHFVFTKRQKCPPLFYNFELSIMNFELSILNCPLSIMIFSIFNFQLRIVNCFFSIPFAIHNIVRGSRLVQLHRLFWVNLLQQPEVPNERHEAPEVNTNDVSTWSLDAIYMLEVCPELIDK